MPRQDPHDLEAWTDCPPGTLSELSHSLHRARRRKAIGRVGLPLLVIALVCSGVWSVNLPKTPSEFTFGGISCSEVQSQLQQYVAGGLEPDERQAFAIHLEKCPLCQEKVRAMRGHTASLAATASLAVENRWSEKMGWKSVRVANLTEASVPPR